MKKVTLVVEVVEIVVVVASVIVVEMLIVQLEVMTRCALTDDCPKSM